MIWLPRLAGFGLVAAAMLGVTPGVEPVTIAAGGALLGLPSTARPAPRRTRGEVLSSLPDLREAYPVRRLSDELE